LIRACQIKTIDRLAQHYPDMPIVVNHCGKPQIAEKKRETWAVDIQNLAQNDNVYCKFSGLTSEAGKNWDTDQIQPYFDIIWASFGARRILWGSDWPVCLLTASYRAWCNACERLTSGLTQEERAHFYRKNAYRAYKRLNR